MAIFKLIWCMNYLTNAAIYSYIADWKHLTDLTLSVRLRFYCIILGKSLALRLNITRQSEAAPPLRRDKYQVHDKR